MLARSWPRFLNRSAGAYITPERLAYAGRGRTVNSPLKLLGGVA